MPTKILSTAGIMLALSLAAAGQSASPLIPGRAVPGNAAPARPAKKAAPGAQRKLTPQQKFVLDTVRLAVALPQSDPQDRLRVLASAANVISPLDQKMARRLSSEGARIESEIIRSGQKPAVSFMASGPLDCAAARNFAENLPEDFVVTAEQSLIGALTRCPRQTLDIVVRKLDAAADKKIIAPRALMAAMEAEGAKSRWSQSRFEKLFGLLPDPAENSGEAENYAAMYAHLAGDVDQDSARKCGLQLLEWLAKLEDSPMRTLALHIVNGALRQALGDDGWQEALRSNVVAGAVARNAENSGMPARVDRPPIESSSVLDAMKANGTDQTGRLRDLPASARAREAAAHGFAAGTAGDAQQAGKYFDMAFAAADEVWEARAPEQNTAAVVEEVSEAAAQVDSVNALMRAQNLRDPSAQAIGMLAVARVVAGTGTIR